MNEQRALDAPPGPARDAALRAEHDALAQRLAARGSIDHARRGAYVGFTSFLAAGLTLKLAWDRWYATGPRRFTASPVLVIVAAALALALAAWAALAFARARRAMRSEDAEFARFRALRARLGLDP